MPKPKSRLGYWKAPVESTSDSTCWITHSNIKSESSDINEVNYSTIHNDIAEENESVSARKRELEPQTLDESFITILRDYCSDHKYGPPEFVVMQTANGFCCSLNYWAGMASVDVPQVTPGDAKEIAAAKALQQLGVERSTQQAMVHPEPLAKKKNFENILSQSRRKSTLEVNEHPLLKTSFDDQAPLNTEKMYSCQRCPQALTNQVYDQYGIRVHMLSNHVNDSDDVLSINVIDDGDVELVGTKNEPVQGAYVSSSIDTSKQRQKDLALFSPSNFFGGESISKGSEGRSSASADDSKSLSKSDKSYISNAFKLSAIAVDWENTYSPGKGVFYCNSCSEDDYAVGHTGEEKIISHIKSKHTDLSALCSKGGSKLDKVVVLSDLQPLKVGEEITCSYCYTLDKKKVYLENKRGYYEHVRACHRDVSKGAEGHSTFPLMAENGRLLVKSIYQCPHCKPGNKSLCKGLKDLRSHICKEHHKITLQPVFKLVDDKHDTKKHQRKHHLSSNADDVKKGFFGN